MSGSSCLDGLLSMLGKPLQFPTTAEVNQVCKWPGQGAYLCVCSFALIKFEAAWDVHSSSPDDMIYYPLCSLFPLPCFIFFLFFFIYHSHPLPNKQPVPVYSFPTGHNGADFTSLLSIYDRVALVLSASVSSAARLVTLFMLFLGLLSC